MVCRAPLTHFKWSINQSITSCNHVIQKEKKGVSLDAEQDSDVKHIPSVLLYLLIFVLYLSTLITLDDRMRSHSAVSGQWTCSVKEVILKCHDDKAHLTLPLEIFIKSHRYGMAQHFHFVP